MLRELVRQILATRVYDVAVESALAPAPLLSSRLHNNVLLKREDLQSIFSFKLRGAYNKMRKLDATTLRHGVITASAGNHAQGVALAAQRLEARARIVMGINTPAIKINQVRRLGAEVILAGGNYDSAAEIAHKMAREQQLTYIHPYDDLDVIAGQGVIGMEILRQHPDPIHAVFVPVGGGGLIAGIGAYIRYLRPDTRVIGVEAEGSACMTAALAAGERVSLAREELDVFADGVAVSQVGEHPFLIASRVVDEMIVVPRDEICGAIKDVFEDFRTMAEPAGALAVAGLKKYVQTRDLAGKNLIAILSGANVNFDRLHHIVERSETGEHREALLSVRIPELKGSFLQFCRAIGARSVTEFNYRFANTESAQIFVGVRVAADDDRELLIGGLRDKGYQVIDMTGNEIAKSHVRYMIGGHHPSAADAATCESLYHFEFPEYRGALLKFLEGLGGHWDISLFHYRNHGAAYGQALVGFRCGGSAIPSLREDLDQIGYRYWEETDNPAYRLFLA